MLLDQIVEICILRMIKYGSRLNKEAHSHPYTIISWTTRLSLSINTTKFSYSATHRLYFAKKRNLFLKQSSCELLAFLSNTKLYLILQLTGLDFTKNHILFLTQSSSQLALLFLLPSCLSFRNTNTGKTIISHDI